MLAAHLGPEALLRGFPCSRIERHIRAGEGSEDKEQDDQHGHCDDDRADLSWMMTHAIRPMMAM
jgi:hypothetical protein